MIIAESRQRPAKIKIRLLVFAILFVFFIAVALTFAPAARMHNWNTPLRWSHWIGFAAWLGSFLFLSWQVENHLKLHDPYLLPITAVLTGWGSMAIWRLSPGFGLRQSAWLIICSLILVIALRIKNILLLLKKYKYIWLVSGLLLSALTFFFGVYPGGEGPHLWLGCCGIYFQPSELLKLLLVIFLAAYLADRIPLSFNFFQLIVPSLALFLSALAILFAQRDLGTALIFIVIYITIIYLASNKRRMFIVGILFMITAGLLGYQFFHVIHVRVDAWLNPWTDPTGGSYQIIQSLLSVASGGVFGRGPGMGSPGLVPIAQSDFIASSIAEEYGLMGTIALYALLAFFMLRGISLAIGARNQYQRYLAAGISTYFAAQSVLIIGGNFRMLPLTGVTLPFISYGGSSLLISFISLFILLIISSQQTGNPAPLVKPANFIVAPALLLTAFFGLAFTNGWWSVVRSASLQTRVDNPRNTLVELYSKRGSIFDRNGQELVSTTGTIGEYQQQYLYPPLSGLIGYNDPVYGRAGLEDSMDEYLSGLKGNPSSLIWWDHLVYGQFPPGLDLRLTIDLKLQQLADSLLAGHTSAMILMNAETGEVLVSASHPNLDPNQVATLWSSWITDPNAPLLNRAAQASYPAGPALAPFLLNLERSPRSLDTAKLTFQYKEIEWKCALSTPDPLDIGAAIASGCPGITAALLESVSSQDLIGYFNQLGFFTEPETDITVIEADTSPERFTLDTLFGGESQIHLSPLQMARGLSILMTHDKQVQPRFILATNNHISDWVLYPAKPQLDFSIPTYSANLDQLQSTEGSFWSVVVNLSSNQGNLTWYIGGTTSEWSGQPFALALVLEENDPSLTKSVGDAVLWAITHP